MKKTLLLLAMVAALAMSTMVGAFAAGGLTITSPEEGDVVIGSVNLEAVWTDADEVEDIDWAIRNEDDATDECRPLRDADNVRYPDVKGNVLNNADDPTYYTWDGTTFTATVDLPVGGYCFVISDEPEARDFVFFAVAEEELTKDSCKDGGWEEMGYRNQGQCVSEFASDGKSAK